MSELLNNAEIEQFIDQGYVRIDNAFTRETADEAIDILWRDLPCERLNPLTWTEPVIRLGMYTQKPFIDSLNTPKLKSAFDQLTGPGNWLPIQSAGTFPIRFPCDKQPTDTGKHVDASFPGDEPNNYFDWRINIKSKGRALLMLVLYSDVNENDAPTVIYRGSHIDVARLLATEGDRGLTFMELANKLNPMPVGEKVYAIGKAGTVYLCHPFIVHEAQAHRGKNPKFMAQPPLLLKGELNISIENYQYRPVEQAIRIAIS